jgi:carbon monoxide dehydrogenase subunit G
MVMEKFKRQTYIDAEPAKIFGWLNDPRHMLEIWPSMVDETNVEVQADGRHSFDWTYKMAGMKFHGHCDTTEIERDRKRVDHNKSGIPSTFRWTFVPQGRGTDVTLEIEYEIPGKLLGHLAAPIVRRLNERDGNTLVENLKERMEIAEAVA